MKLTRGKRIALELLGPPLLGAILLFAYASASAVWNEAANGAHESFHLKEWLGIGMAYMFFAYSVAAIPAIIYTVIMEWRFARKFEPGSWQTVQLSTFLGVVAGMIVGLMVDEFNFHSAFWLMSSIGLSVGFLLGLLIKHWSTEK